MKKRMKIIIIIIIISLILLSGTALVLVNYFMPIDVKFSNRVIKKLSKTDKIVVKDGKVTLGTITEEIVITRILSIMSETTTSIGGAYTCSGTNLYFEMYDTNKLIDKVAVWINGNIMPYSIAKGCAKYSLPLTNKNDLNIIIEEQTGTKFFRVYDYSEECDQALELIYETEEQNYYFSCIKSDKVFIEFVTTNLKLPVKEALDNGYISIEELIRKYPNLFVRK